MSSLCATPRRRKVQSKPFLGRDSLMSKTNINYDNKLQKVLQRKKSLEEFEMRRISRKVEENSI